MRINYSFEICSVFDSWGKIPSSILEGNLYDFGGFSECLNIERNAKRYETQYCLGQLNFELKGFPRQKSYQDEFHNFPVPDIMQAEQGENPQIEQRMGVPV